MVSASALGTRGAAQLFRGRALARAAEVGPLGPTGGSPPSRVLRVDGRCVRQRGRSGARPAVVAYSADAEPRLDRTDEAHWLCSGYVARRLGRGIPECLAARIC